MDFFNFRGQVSNVRLSSHMEPEVNGLHMPTLEFAILVAFLVIAPFLKHWLSAYSSEKGKNLATKEDIDEITRKVEGVRSEISRVNAVEELKRKLKYEACLEALSVIDAYFSQRPASLPRPTPQPVSTVRAREAHSKLILSCDDVRIVNKFAEIYFGHREGETPRLLNDLLNEFRNLIRVELGFGEELSLNNDIAWIATALGDPENTVLEDPLPPRSSSPLPVADQLNT